MCHQIRHILIFLASEVNKNHITWTYALIRQIDKETDNFEPCELDYLDYTEAAVRDAILRRFLRESELVQDEDRRKKKRHRKYNRRFRTGKKRRHRNRRVRCKYKKYK